MAVASVQLNFRIPAELNDKVGKKAQETGETKTDVVRKALEEYLKK